jgi:hypothetical protein
MLVLVLGVTAGVDPLLCTLRGLIGGMVGWVAGALWAFVMCRLEPPEIVPSSPLSSSDEESDEPTDE